jgi:hypothetical protein
MMRLPFSLGPTLLLDEPDHRAEMETILQASSQRGMHVAKGDGVVDLFGPKIIFSNRPLFETSRENVLRVALIPTSENVPPLGKTEEDEITERFQARFLGYFLRNFNNFGVPKFDVSNLRQPLQFLARTLGSVVVGD